MNVASLAVYTPRFILEGLFVATLLILILFGITSLAVGAFYVIRIVASYLRGEPFGAARGRAVAAGQASTLAGLAIACGPLVARPIGLLSCGAELIIEGRSGFTMGLGLRLLTTGLGVVAGLIAGGAFLLSSRLLGRFRKTVKRLRGGGVWDPETRWDAVISWDSRDQYSGAEKTDEPAPGPPGRLDLRQRRLRPWRTSGGR